MMQLLADMLSNNLVYCPELAEYNEVVVKFIASHLTIRPDMSIEGCKGLIEGLSKFVSFKLDPDAQSSTKWRHLSLRDKFEECLLRLNLEGYEAEFLKESSDLVLKLGQIRNERGDISHGQAYPKSSYSNEDFAKFIILWTEGLCYFVVSRYIWLKQSQEQDNAADIYTTQQFEEFDNYLDSLYPNIDISYSKALKGQDPLKYEVLIDDYFTRC